jgi:hypothetical protein
MEHGCIAHQLDAVFVLVRKCTLGLSTAAEERQSYGTCQCLRIKMWVPVQSASTCSHSVRQCVTIHVCVCTCKRQKKAGLKVQFGEVEGKEGSEKPGAAWVATTS